ncbi:class I SAM-dependent methyltransferase [Pseudomonas sp. REP124]|uniref:class I SAM-dependent methyltransferase n=1 Tax=Pseudomonas sp. REP124 TaxID=2875731 RepID=UPI001CCCE163|nr:class I SAM-dependent methyltransferase [Pseudomonas sp. REP124]MBZ9784463.1 class I SAM-dependent methyltransferase [Pseudomonas sp. REP124]
MSSEHTPFPKAAFESLASSEARHWWFRARNRLILWVLKSRAAKFQNFLEIGCGTGFVLDGISRNFPEAELFGTEYFEEGLAHARGRIPTATFEQMDARLLSDVERYDLIGAFDVIEHINEDEAVISNISRALNKNGCLLLTVPQHRWLWSEADERACHVRRYTRAELIGKVRKAGLEVQYVTSFVSLLVPLMWLSRQRRGQKNAEKNSEFDISDTTNRMLEFAMKVEFKLIQLGLPLPFGGSLLVLAKKAGS